MERLEAPKITEHGTPISAVPLGGKDYHGNPIWHSAAPSLYDLRCLRTPEFAWDKDAHEVFFFALVSHSDDRRIRESHKGLFEEAAQSLIRKAFNAFANDLQTAGVFCWQRPEPIDRMVAEIVSEMRDHSHLQRLCDEYIKLMLSLMLSDADMTNGNYLLSVSDRNPLRMEPEEGVALIAELNNNKQTIVRRINRALDVISIYTSDEGRLPYIQLEMFLTSMRRVVYAVHNRAF